MLQFDILLLSLMTAVLTLSILAARPKPFRDPARHVLICCAHSDDCVIMGAEYAYGAIQCGLSIRIVYLTCSAPHPDTDVARTRKAEALKVWSSLDVPYKNFTFINLSQSPVAGPLGYSDRDITRATESLKAAVLSLPENAAVIVPAQGESHVDHRIARKISLQAIIDSKRQDLLVYETPEYNAFLSFVHCPKRAIRAILTFVPLLNRLLMPYVGRSNYVKGPPGLVFRDTADRLAMKKQLLRCFSSQNGDRLALSFGHKTLYRQVSLTKSLREPTKASGIPAFGAYCGISVLAFGVALLGVAFLTAHEISRGLIIELSPMPADKYVGFIGILVTTAYLVRRFRGTASLETSLFVWAAALGLIFGVL